jgi:formate hydrogenlyase transcriptional activator
MKLNDRQNILNALNQCGWEITGSNRATEILGMRPTTLHSKIKKKGIKRPN